jgi:hypothetical protein
MAFDRPRKTIDLAHCLPLIRVSAVNRSVYRRKTLAIVELGLRYCGVGGLIPGYGMLWRRCSVAAGKSEGQGSRYRCWPIASFHFML